MFKICFNSIIKGLKPSALIEISMVQRLITKGADIPFVKLCAPRSGSLDYFVILSYKMIVM